MCQICIELDKKRITWKEADYILYSGEIPLDYDHFVEVLDKIDQKQKEADESR
jgi:hypothetical protein